MSESVTSVATLIDQTTTPLASTPYKSPSCPNLGHVAPISEVVNQAVEEEDKSKWKAGLSILRKFIGAKELWRISIPASLLEPIPNLEYWHYVERPDYFAQINDYEDPLHRMLALVRWWVSKDIKHVHGKLIKPYNSVLGEQFLCRWQVAVPALDGHEGTKDFIDFKPDDQVSQPNNASTSIAEEDEDAVKDSETAEDDDFHDAVDDNYNQALESVLVRAVMEQISHHPPVSAFQYECPSRGIEARGVDQLAIGFTGTSVKINSGDWANGVFIKLKRPNPSLATTTTSFEDEEYHITLPTAHVNGWLRGSLYVSLSDHCIISCPKTGYSCVLEYKEEKWLGKAKCEVEGKIYHQAPKPGASLEDYFFCSGNTTDSEVDKQLKKKTRKEQVKKIFQNHQVVGDISGSWKGEIFYNLSDSVIPFNLQGSNRGRVDISKIRGIPKIVRPLDEQSPLESRNIWKELTEALLARDFTTASRAKLAVEDAQRKLANERKQKGEDFTPYYFEKEDVGKWKLKTSPSW